MAGIATKPARNTPRLDSLDALRGLAACGVAFLYHAYALFHGVSAVVLPAPLHWFVVQGWTLVDLFFLISGYIFAHVYLGAGAGLEWAGLGDFAMARVARLYPLHLLMLLASALLFAGAPANTLAAFTANLLMAQAFVGAVGHAFDGPSWSISVEVVCYVLFALGAAGGVVALRRVTLLAIAGSLVYFLLLARSGGPWVWDCLPRALLGFFLGQALWHGRAILTRVPGVVLIVIAAAGLALDWPKLSPILPLDLLAWPALLLLALRARWMAIAPLRWLGARSYAIYLVHYPLLLLAERWALPLHGGLGAGLAVVTAFAALALLVADLSYRFVEVPARRAIRTRWVHKGQAARGQGARAD